MKKFWKATVIPGFSCILVGVLLIIILMIGFPEELAAYKGQFTINPDNVQEFFEFNRFDNVTRTGKRYSSLETNESYDFQVPEQSKVTGICFEFAVGDVRIKEGDTMELHVEDMFEDAIVSKVKDGIWYIEDALMEEGRVHSDYFPRIEITLPKETSFEQIEIYLAAGTFDAAELKAKQVLLDVSAGSMKVRELEAKESMKLTNGVGEIDVYDLEAHNLTVDNGVGSVALTGKISGDNVVTCGIGEVKMKLTDRREVDFNYTIDCGIGEVDIDGISYHGNVEEVQNNRAGDSFKLDCGIGHIELEVDGN